MADVLALTDRLEAELPAMLHEHQEIVVALQRLQQLAARADRADLVDFADRLVQHARTEEEVMSPRGVARRAYVRSLGIAAKG